MLTVVETDAVQEDDAVALTEIEAEAAHEVD